MPQDHNKNKTQKSNYSNKNTSWKMIHFFKLVMSNTTFCRSLYVFMYFITIFSCLKAIPICLCSRIFIVTLSSRNIEKIRNLYLELKQKVENKIRRKVFYRWKFVYYLWHTLMLFSTNKLYDIKGTHMKKFSSLNS